MKMKKILFALTVMVVLVPAYANSQETASASQIAIVDVKKILNESSATKSIQQQIEEKRKAIQSEISKQEETLRKTDQDLAQQRSVLSKEAMDKKVQEFKTSVVEAQRNVQTKRSQLEKAYANALGEVEKVVVSIVSELADKKGFQVAIPKATALYAKDSLDISNEVLKTLDERLPKVKVKLEN
jgi:outer membrane protein